MAKRIKFTYNDKDYILEFSRSTVKQMENQGFAINQIDSKPETMISMLFAGAFLMHHRFIYSNTKLLDEMFSKFPNRETLVSTLAQMYQEPVLSLLDEPEEDEGNIKWESEE